MTWIFYLLFMLATGVQLLSLCRRFSTRRRISLKSAQLKQYRALKDTYFADGYGIDGDKEIRVQGDLIWIRPSRLMAAQSRLNSQVGSKIEVFDRAGSGTTSNAPMFKGRIPMDLILYVAIFLCALVALLHDVFGIDLLFLIVRSILGS